MNRYRIFFRDGRQTELSADSVGAAYELATPSGEVVAIGDQDQTTWARDLPPLTAFGEALDDLARLMKARDHLAELEQESPQDKALISARQRVESCLRSVVEKMR